MKKLYRANNKVILGLTVFGVVCCVMAKNPTISFEEVKALKNDLRTLIIDVREPSEVEEFGAITGSINIPLGKFEKTLSDEFSAEEFKKLYSRDKPSKDFPIIVFCRSGRRSGMAQETAIKLGFTNVKNYEGSWLEWEKRIRE